MTPRTPVRVSFVIDNLGRAGTETQLTALIRSLDRTVVEPSLVLLDGESASSRSLEPNCPVLRLGVRKIVGRRGMTAAIRLRAFWKWWRPDIAQFYFLDSAYFGIPVAKWCGVPRILRVRNNLGYWRTRTHRLFDRLLRPFVDGMLTNSEAGRGQLLAEGWEADRIAVIENGVEVAGRLPFGPPLAPVVGCVANLRPVKNIDGLIRAARIVCDRRPDVRFEIAGDGDRRAELERLRDSLGLSDRVRFLGSIEDVPAFLQGITVAVLPSHSEGLSNAVLEYMAAGKAVVATDVGANRSVLGEAGVLVPPGDDRVLAAAMMDLLSDPMRLVSFGSAARDRALSRFNRAAMARRFEQFCRELVNRSGERNPIPLRTPRTLREAA